MLPLSIPARFRIIRPIGSGGMGAVYEALDIERNVRVALKTVLHHDPDALARFKYEFRALQNIHHPNLVALGELVSEERGTFFTMELVDGVDLVAWVCGDSRDNPRSNGATAIDLPAIGIGTGTHDTDRDVVSSETPPARSHARPSAAPRRLARFDETRLRETFRQIVVGLSALHDSGKIHRDVKPSNVRVTPEGRVVLLDFGLVFDVDARAATDTNIVGTPAYMAPEQTLSEPVGPEADWYALGAMLYLCLTGRLPFEGAAVAVLMAKHYQEPKQPSSIAADVPPDLEKLCMELLQFDPRARPRAAEIMHRLVSTASKPPQASKPDEPASSASTPFVGRADEMATLQRALADVVEKKGAVSVVLYGESGVGKSSVARRFLESARSDVDAMVLEGRCYEREAVPYKAFDEVIDTLSRRLARMPKEDVLALLPSRVEALAQLFPALGRVPLVAQAVGILDRDPHERRRGAFRALRELLRKMCARHTLVIAIDDLQWTDTDSLSLLSELLRPPDAPPLLLVVTMRGTEGASNPSAPPKLALQIPGDVRAVHIGRLAKEDARELAITLLRRDAGMSADEAVAIAKEADGHPLFIDELVRHAAAHGRDAPAGGLRLDDALFARVQRLDLAARRVLEVACVLGAPVAQDVVANAAGLEMSDFTRAVSLLRTSNLVRTRGGRVTDAIEPFHDRVREAVSGRLDPDAKRECHARLASALELAKGSDPEVLATHWAGAGEVAKAARYAISAADQATQALAFERAARLYGRAIAFVPATDPRLRALREQEGEALANAGDCARAAVSFARAAEGANPDDALDLRRRASEQLLRAGEVRRGLDATRAVLAEVGLAMPRTRFGVIVALLWVRLLLRLRGLGYVARQAKDVPTGDLTRVDVCWSASCTLNYADALTGALFQARHLLLALRAGERLRVTRALAIEAGFAGAVGPSAWPRVVRTLALAREAASGCTGPYAGAIVSACEGIALVMNFRFADAVPRLESAIATFRDHCPGSDWEAATARQFLFFAQFFTSRFRELLDAQEIALKDAVERGDRYAMVMIRVGMPNRNWLVFGDPVPARRELDAGLRDWPSQPFQIMHFYALVADSYIALYQGDHERAAERIRATRRDVRRSMLLTLMGPRLDYASICGHVALARAAAEVRVGKKPDLREVDRCIRVFGRPTSAVIASGVLSMRASRAILAGDRERALALLDELARLDSEDTWLIANCARWIRGAMRGGPEGEASAREAVDELDGRGVRVGIPVIATQLPGFEPYVSEGSAAPSP